MSAERLQKVLASAGIASRRDCEEFISAGRVSVNGKVVLVPGTRVDPEQDEVAVDGRPIGQISPRTYVMLNKPAGVVSTADDPQGRPTVVELVDLPQRLFSVGRLDYDSEGLLLMTDDGELTQRLTHPSYQIEKEYRALLDQAPSAEAIREWRNGVMLDGVPTAPAWVDVIERGDQGVWVRVVLHEGRKRQIREVAKLLGYEVLRLIRVREGPVVLGDLPVGEWRALTDEQVEALWAHVGGRESEAPAAPAEARPASLAVGETVGADAPRRRERPAAGGARRTARPSTPKPESEAAAGGGDDPKPAPRAARPRAIGGDRPVPRRDTRPYEEREPQDESHPASNDRSFDNRGVRRSDRPDVNSQDEHRPDPGNERLPDCSFREEKRGPGREWHERSEQEKRDRPAMRVSRPRFGDRSGATRRVGFPFRPRPPRDDEDKR